jgi:diguanylate cyclase (GGDEF)-like protein
MVAIALFAMAGAVQPQAERAAEVAGEPVRRRASWAPCVAVAVVFGLLILDRRHSSLLPLSLVIAAVLMAALVSVRQFLAQRDLLQTQGELNYQSLHDALTGLPNRALVFDRAEQMLARGRRLRTPVAALYVDIDAFKYVNDSFGQTAGDELLRVVAARLSAVVRESDTVGRLGDDEFVVLLDNFTLNADPELVAQRVCQVIAQPVDLNGAEARTASVTASVGIAVGQRGSADELLRDADFALYEAKRTGKNRWIVLESSMQSAARDRVELERDLNVALDRNQFQLLYQPIFDLPTETVNGVEALIRWHHPDRGTIAPDTFIPVAEETGLIVPIGRWVLNTACRQAAAWQHEGRPLAVSVNVSALQLDRDQFVDEVRDALANTALDPAALTLEITETTLMRDAEAAARRLEALKTLGVRIAIDDFGTGYSSLAYLSQFPVDALKIDRSFISGVAPSRESKVLIHTLVQLGKTLGLETFGEGIEDRAQLQHLQREHCDSGQGFLWSGPLEADAIGEFLTARLVAV